MDWLVLQSACVLTRSHAVGMWQALLEEGVLNHGNHTLNKAELSTRSFCVCVAQCIHRLCCVYRTGREAVV